MASDPDTGWISLATLGTPIATFVFGGLVAAFLRSMSWSKAEGRSEGGAATWRANVEARLVVIENRKDRIDEVLRQVPTRSEMKDDLDRNLDRVRADMTTDSTAIRNEMREGMKALGLQISQISTILYENRNSQKRD